MSPQFKFEFAERPNLPPLAWSLEVRADSPHLRVTHGAKVQTGTNGFFEGAWAGDFAAAQFELYFMTGTGAKRDRGGVLLVAPNHTLDRLNVLRRGGTLYVSNSLSYLLAITDEELDPNFPYYDSLVSSIKFGLNTYERSIPTKSKTRVYFYYACNLLVTETLDLIEYPKTASPAFSSYTHYRSYLDATVESIVRNAGDSLRQSRFTPLATSSRGYDSPAAMVIAKKSGCREAVSFRRSRGAAADEDCGTVIGEKLGISIREYDRLEYCNRTDFPEVMNSGGPNEFLSFGEDLAGRLVFTGFHGDKVWDKNCDKVSRDLVRGDASGSSLTELRLRVGFFHLPVPFIGVDSHPSIHAISNSPEMRPWSLGNSYDRPIPRRIVEEAGVPREMFGQRKLAAGVVVPMESLAHTMSAVSLADFKTYCKRHEDVLRSFSTRCMKLIKQCVRWNEAAARLTARIGRRIGVTLIKIPIVIPHKLVMLTYGYLGREAYLFHWGVDKLILRYRSAVNEN